MNNSDKFYKKHIDDVLTRQGYDISPATSVSKTPTDRCIIHPIFGKGLIVSTSENSITVYFAQGIRQLNRKWLNV